MRAFPGNDCIGSTVHPLDPVGHESIVNFADAVLKEPCPFPRTSESMVPIIYVFGDPNVVQSVVQPGGRKSHSLPFSASFTGSAEAVMLSDDPFAENDAETQTGCPV